MVKLNYKVVIKKCSDEQVASTVANAVSEWSGSPVETILAAISAKDVVLRKETDEKDASEIKARFEAVGAIVEVSSVGEAPVAAAAPVATSATTSSQSSRNDDEDDEDEDENLRILSDSEYAEMLKSRADIFEIDKDRKTSLMLILAVVLALATGAWFSTREIIEVATDFFDKIPEERTAKIIKELPETIKEEDKKKEEEEIKVDEKKKLKPTKKKGRGGRTGGGGDPRARVTRKGVLGIISGAVKGKTVASADLFGQGGFASGIDAVLSGVGGLKAGGGGGSGRKGAAGIGYGAGIGSGFGGGSGGVDDLIGSLMGGDGGSLNLKKRGSLKIAAPKFTKGGAMTGGRSRASIMRVVMQNISALRYAYNKRLREKPGLKGKITCKFAIDEFGKVIFVSVVGSTMGDKQLEQVIKSKIKRWVFEKIDKPGDVTEVVYPFVFSQ